MAYGKKGGKMSMKSGGKPGMVTTPAKPAMKGK